MPTKKAVKRKQKSAKKKNKLEAASAWLKKHKVISVLIFILLIAGVYFAKNQYDISQERARYKQAEAVIDNVIENIYKEVGEPDAKSEDKHCAHSSRKYSKGPLSCSFTNELVYDVNSAADAENQSKKIKNILTETSSLKISYSDSLVFFNEKPEKSTFVSRGSDLLFNNYINPACKVNFVYFDTRNPLAGLKSKSSYKNLSVIINCGGPAKSSYYETIR